MIQKLKLLITSVLLGSLWTVSAQTPETVLPKLTLKQCLEHAVEHSYSLGNANLECKEAGDRTKEIRAAVLPQANASASLTDNLAIPVVMLPGEIIGQPGEMIPAELGVQYEAMAAVQLNQVIFNPALFAGIKVARNAEELMRLKAQLTKEQLIYDVAAVYFDILHSEQQLKSIRGNIALQDSLFAKTALKVREELVREIDLNRIRVNITGLKVQQENLEGAVSQQKRYLQILANLPSDKDFNLDESIVKSVSVPVTLTEETLFSNRTEIALLDRQKELNALELKAVKMQYLPALSFVASGAYQFQSQEFKPGKGENWFKSAFVGLRLNIPIFDGSAKHHKMKQIKRQQLKLDNDSDFSKQGIVMEQRNSLTELNVSYQAVRLQEDNLSLAERNYEQSRLLYHEGLYSVTDLLQTENSLHEAQTAYISEIIRFKKAELKLMKAEGKLMQLIN